VVKAKGRLPSTLAGTVEAARFRTIDRAFREGNLEALRAAVNDPAVIPNGVIPGTNATCLTYAIYWSPRPFIRELLELGANASAPAADGFPPLIAALSCTRTAPGASPRPDVNEIVRLLLGFGADPNQRGINDWTPLHMAVAERNGIALQLLLDGGADPDLRTRIDDYETAADMARSAGLDDLAATLDRRGAPLGQRMRSGMTLLVDVPGSGEPVRRQHTYRLRLRMTIVGGAPVRWPAPWGDDTLDDDRTARITHVRINRGTLINGLFYGVEGMRIGGLRRIQLAPHMAWGDAGIPGVIPAGASLIVEIEVLSSRP